MTRNVIEDMTIGKTYATRENMVKALEQLEKKVGIEINYIELRVGVSWRFSPVIILRTGEEKSHAFAIAHKGFCVVG